MIALGLTQSEQKAFEAGLRSHHSIKTEINVLDLDHNYITTATGRILSGQVDVDATSDDATRTLSLQILDHDNALNFDNGDPAIGANYADRMLQVRYCVWSQEFPTWVEVPVFTGPIRTLTREDNIVTLSASSKESLSGEGLALLTRTWPNGTRKTTIIKQIFALCGEAFTDIPDWNYKTTGNMSVTAGVNPWKTLKTLVSGLGDVRLTYDGRGIARVKRLRHEVRWVFDQGNNGTLVQTPKVSYDISEFKNMVVVKGGIPKGKKTPIVAIAHAPANHPLSAKSLSRGGVNRYFREDITAEQITDPKAAKAYAEECLNRRLREAVTIDFAGLNIPHLEEWDNVMVRTNSWSWSMQLTKFSIPLTSDGLMTIGRSGLSRKIARPRPAARKNPRRRVVVPRQGRIAKKTAAAKKKR